jgi:hypothetical protein
VKKQINLCRSRGAGSSETALDPGPALWRKSFLALAGAAVVLLGCQQDQGGTPSAVSSQPTEQNEDIGGTGGAKGGPSGSAIGGADPQEEEGPGTGSGSASPGTTGATGTGSGTGSTGSGSPSGGTN